ncbi:MAG: FtsH protease activity modulator HflK, partial [Woeseiaceae bacterium]|nr:FtsH protease activity modulator HflK [Woeseiaceae bacterium]
MAWNEPGNGKDPWRRDDQEPTDLDKIVQSWQGRLGGLLGGGKPGTGGGSGYFVLIFAIVAWGLTGLYRVDEAERGVVQRFGKHVDTTLPGLRWHLPFPIERVDKVNTIEIQEKSYNREMLTADEQYVSVDMVVQYRREDPVLYSFKVDDPDATVGDVTESALREVVGTTDLETLVSGRREEIASRTREVLQSTLDSYETGIRVTSVNLRDVKYPQNVQAAVDDAQKARNDSERYFREAETYANDILPKARGDAARMLEDARAYRDRVIANAEGEAARFEALLAEYERAPEVTRERLYIEAVEQVYSNTNKVILDSEGSGNLLYLPIDKLIESRSPGYAPSMPREQDYSTQQQ